MKKFIFLFIGIFLLFESHVYCQSCPAPVTSLIDVNPTDAQITLSSGSIIEYGPHNYTPGTAATAGAGGTLINCFCGTPIIYPLTPGTVYDLYARVYCGSVGYSPNSTKLVFSTLPCPETFNFGTIGSTPHLNFGGFGYYSNYYYNVIGYAPDPGTEKIVKFTPDSNGYYELHLQRPITNFDKGTFMVRQSNGTCNFFDINYALIGYANQEPYNTTYGNNGSGIYCENVYYRLGPFTAGTSYDLFFDANDTTIDDGMTWPFLNYSDIDMSYIGCNAAPLSVTSSAGTMICAGMSATLTEVDGILSPGGSYKWYSGSCGGTLAGTGSSITVSPTSTTTYYVRGEAPCGNSICKSITITVVTAAITPSGNQNVCGFTTLTTPTISGCIYQWKKNGVNLQGYVNPTFQTGYSGSYTVEVHSPYCTITTPVPTNLNVSLNATITTSGPTAVCAGDSVVLTANAGPGVTYQWNINGSYAAGITTQTCTIKSTSQVFVTVNMGSCFNFSPAVNITVGFSTATIFPLGTLNTCPGTPVTLSVNNSPGLTYQWKLNGTDIPGATAYNYPATLTGNYTVALSNGTCPGTTTNARTVAYYQVPVSTITTNTPTTFCSGGAVHLYSPGGNYTRQWKKNGNSIAGATSSYYPATSSGNYKLVLTNTFGCSATSATTVVTVNPLPSAVITAGDPTTFCYGSSGTLNAPTGANLTYQWKKGGNNIAGATSSNYTATSGGSYKVTVTNTSTGCAKTTATGTLVTVNPKPFATITPQGPTTFCAGGNVVLAANAGAGLSYAWKKNNAFIGVNTINYAATTAGSYQVKVTDTNGCNKTSTAVTVTVPCKIGESKSEGESAFDVSVYPNPSSGDFIFEMENANSEKITVTIYDISGRMIQSGNTYQSQLTINNKELNAGIYFAKIARGNSVKEVRLVKLNGE